MKVFSYDIFDTCLIRKCGSPRNMFDILALRVFNDSVSDNTRNAFVVSRIQAEEETWSPSQTLHTIYEALIFQHPHLKTKEELIQIEEDCEREMLVPVRPMLDRINAKRMKDNQIVFISDMYLRSSLLKEILTEYGFFKEGDLIFVSCEHNATKAHGALYEVVKQGLSLSSFKNWSHYGDNKVSDYRVPKRLGINAHRVECSYSPYQQNMINIPDLKYQWSGMLAGLSRSIRYQYECNSHYDFFLDIVLPLYVSFTIRVMKNAADNGIDKLFFCARDSYPIYRIAKQLQKVYPTIDIEYFYVSRKSLYEGDECTKIAYFEQIGLASHEKNNAIVDICSSGKSLFVLNEILGRNNYKRVKGYFFELLSKDVIIYQQLGDYYAEIIDPYMRNVSKPLRRLPSNWYIYELFFSLNSKKRTIGYSKDGDSYSPIFEDTDIKEYKFDELDYYERWRESAISQYVIDFIELGLNEYADAIFERYAIPQLGRFFVYPEKHYLSALKTFNVDNGNGIFVPYVDNSIFRLPLNVIKKRTMWKRGTIVNSLPEFVTKRLLINRE